MHVMYNQSVTIPNIRQKFTETMTICCNMTNYAECIEMFLQQHVYKPN